MLMRMEMEMKMEASASASTSAFASVLFFLKNKKIIYYIVSKVTYCSTLMIRFIIRKFFISCWLKQ